MNPLEWALLPETCKAVLRIFHGFKGRGQQIFTSQGWLARKIGVCRLTILRAITRLVRLGLVSRKERHSRFWEYTLLEAYVAARVTSGVTSQPISPYINSLSRRKARSLPKPPRRITDWELATKLVRGGMDYYAAIEAAAI